MSETNALPLEVMKLVVANMPYGEWARVSRTCRAWASLQPKALVSWPGTIPELRWVLCHWREAESMYLNTSDMDLRSEEVQQILASGARKVGALQRLGLVLHGAEAEGQGVKITPEWLRHLFAAVAGSLEVLQVDVPIGLELPPPPPFQRLKHALLTLRATSEQELPQLAFLHQLAYLETLGPKIDVTLAIPPLNLSGSTRLRRLSILCLVPTELRLPATCTAVTYEGNRQVTGAHFKELCTLLTCMTVIDYKPSGPMMPVAGLSRIMDECMFNVLTVLHVFLHECPLDETLCLALGSSAAALRQLVIRANMDVVLDLTFPLALRVLVVQAGRSVELFTAHPHLLVETLTGLHLQAAGNMWGEPKGVTCPALVEGFAAKGDDAAVRGCIERYHAGKGMLLSIPEEGIMPKPVKMIWAAQAGKRFCGVMCGACFECLHYADILPVRTPDDVSSSSSSSLESG